MKKKVCTLVVTYNRKEKLKHNLECLIRQSYKSTILLIDNNSNDGTYEYIKELVEYPFILQTEGSNSREYINKYALDNNISFNSNIESSSYTLISEFAKIGLGIGICTKEYIDKDLKDKKLFELNIKEKLPKRYIAIATLNNQIPNFSTKKLIEIIKKQSI